MIRCHMLFLAILCAACPCSLTAQEKAPGAIGPPVEIPGTQRLTLHSAIAGADYALDVNLPRHYGDSAGSFPVLFLLDGQWDFPLVSAMYGEQYYDGFVPEIVIVGISRAGAGLNHDSLRVSDLTPTRVASMPQSGNAPLFLRCIKEEIIPFVQSRFRVLPGDRALMGTSLGGLFTLYAMFHETPLFAKYILTSPAAGWDNGVLFSWEKEYAESHARLPVKLYMARAELEGPMTEYERFLAALTARHYAGLELATSVVEGMGHSGGKAVGFARGLQAVYARPVVALGRSRLDALTGTYRLSPQAAASVIREGDHLVLVAPDSTRFPLLASSERDFFVKGFYFFLTFHTDAAGNATGARVETFGGAFDVTREASR